MSLIKYGIAVGIGYYLGRPDGRRQLVRLRQQAVEIGRRPEVKQLQERGRDIAGERAAAAKNFASQKFAGKDKTAKDKVGKHEVSDAGILDDDPTVDPPTTRHRGIRGIGRRRPRPHPASPTTSEISTDVLDPSAPASPVAADDASTEVGRSGAEVPPATAPGRSAPTPGGVNEQPTSGPNVFDDRR